MSMRNAPQTARQAVSQAEPRHSRLPEVSSTQRDGNDGQEMRVFSPPLRALYLVSALAGVAIGLFNPLISALLNERGVSELGIGLNASTFFAFTLLGAPLAGWLIHRIGTRGTIAIGIVLTAIAAMQLPWWHHQLAWFAARAVMGMGIGLYMIGGQTALNASVSEAQRSLVGGLHALAFGVGLGVGPILGGALYGASPILAFYLGGVLLLMGLPIVGKHLPTLHAQTPSPRFDLVSRLSLPLHAIFAYGMAEATLLTLYPVFLLQNGYSVSGMSFAFAAFIGGGLIGTLPLGHLADRHGRERMLAICAGVGAVATIALAFAPSLPIAAAVSLLVGASLGPVFAIALGIVGQRLSREELPGGSALFTMAFSLGSLVAPWLSALIMRELGSVHVFTLSAVLFLSLLLRLLWRRPAVALVSAEA